MIDDLELLHANPEEVDFAAGDEPKFENEHVFAKAFLQKASTFSGDNLYDHLSDVLNKILAERPENVIDFFEEYSRKVKEKRFKPLTDHLEDIYVEPGRYDLSSKILPLLKPLGPGEPSTVDPEDLDLANMTKNNMMELLYFFEQVGVGLPRTEMFVLTLQMRQIIRTEPIAKIRFWGKIYGLEKNYTVLETELKDEEYAKLNEKYQDEQMEQATKKDELQEKLDDIAKEQAIPGEGEPLKPWGVLPPLPKNPYEEPPEAPVELSGIGVNRKVYYVCTAIGEPWVRLPDVTPKQIRVARKIYKSFTGNLDQAVNTYPEFPGAEKHLLRAQIARISASTHISPLGFYTFNPLGGEGEGGMDEEEGGNKTDFQENPKYDPVPLKDLLDSSMLFWVHHMPFILNQGRTTWWNPNPLPEVQGEGDLGEGEEAEAKPINASPEPETGPPLLTPCSEDVKIDAIPAWSVRGSSSIADEYGIAVVRSNFWPGAFCFATQGKLFQNVYFGFGNKFLVPNFSPDPLPPVSQEYPIGPEILEILDPTGAEEEAWRIAHLPKEKPPMILKGEDEMPGEGEEDEEDEDD